MSIKSNLLILSLALILAACTPAEVETVPTPETDPVGDTSMPAEGDTTDAQMETESEYDYQIDMTNFTFSVEEMTASPGDTVTILLNTEEGFHDFVIDEFDVQSEAIEAGDQTELTFTIPEDAEPGDYEYYCSIGNHRAMGMVGVLTVTE